MSDTEAKAPVTSAIIAAQAAATSANRAATAAVVSALLSAVAGGINAYMLIESNEKVEARKLVGSETIEKDRIIDSIIKMAASGPGMSSQIAYCNIKLWTAGGLIDRKLGDSIIEAFENQRQTGVKKGCDI